MNSWLRLAVLARQRVAPAPRRHDGPSWDPASRTNHRACWVPRGLEKPRAPARSTCRGISQLVPGGTAILVTAADRLGSPGVAPGGRSPIAPPPRSRARDRPRGRLNAPAPVQTAADGTVGVSLVPSSRARWRPPAHRLPPACRGPRSRSARAATASRACPRPPWCRRTRHPGREGCRRCRRR